MNALTFNNITFNPIIQNNEIWLTSTELAKALDYKSSKSVANLYKANSDEFSDKMTEVIESMTSSNIKGLATKIRIFSLRGCHLIAMFARTQIAKKFRIWVLDILDKEAKSTSKQREVLISACEKLAVGNMARPQAYALVANQFGYQNPVDIPVALIPQATAFAYEMILRLKPTEPTTPQETNETKMFWKLVGLNQYHETSKALDELQKALWKAEDKLKEVHKTRSFVYDALSEPKHNVGGQAKIAEINKKALAFIQRQNAMKA